MASVSEQQAIEVALCHGWIDGQLNPYGDRCWLIRFTPRSARSRWSEINRTTVTQLIAKGRVSPAGLAQVEAARLDGRREGAYAPQSTAAVPPDLQAALEANPAAQAFFATLTGANRYAVLYRVQDARTVQTRQARIDKFIAMRPARPRPAPVPQLDVGVRPMNLQALIETTPAMLAQGKGLRATDESIGTCNQHFASAGIAQTVEMRRAYRHMLLTAPGLGA